jgi:hypothetical protein
MEFLRPQLHLDTRVNELLEGCVQISSLTRALGAQYSSHPFPLFTFTLRL